MSKILEALVLAAVVAHVSAEAQVMVAGVVLDSGGAPVPNSLVEAFPVRAGGFVGNIPWIKTDQNGKFRITVAAGEYEIRAKNELEGYPDPNFLMSVDPSAVFPTITSRTQEIGAVEVKLGVRGGILEGIVRDEATQVIIPKAKVTIRDELRRERSVEVFSDAGGHFQLTVPKRPLQILATAPGYKVTSYENGEALTLSSGEHRTVTVGLAHK